MWDGVFVVNTEGGEWVGSVGKKGGEMHLPEVHVLAVCGFQVSATTHLFLFICPCLPGSNTDPT